MNPTASSGRAGAGRGQRLPTGSGPRVVALGWRAWAGGHACARCAGSPTSSLRSSGWRDDGGSSGRLRRELGAPPPGDLRMALAALCGDDVWGRTWSSVVQHRFSGGDLGGHAVGNLLITALWEQTGDIVAGLDWVGALLGAHGRVLPACSDGVQIVAEVRDLPGPSRAQQGVWAVPGGDHRGHRGHDRARAGRPAGPPGGGRGDRRGAGAGHGAGVLVHLGPGRAAGSRDPRGGAGAPRPPGSSC